MRVGYKVASIVAVIGAISTVIIYNVIVNKSVSVVTKEIEIDNLPEEFEGFTILQLADLHSKNFGKNQENLLNIINELKFDIIAITGDMQNRQDENYNPFITLLEGIDNKKDVFYTPGNHGPMVYKDEISFNSFIKTDVDKEKVNKNKNIKERELTDVGIKLKELGVKFLDKAYEVKRGNEVLWLSELVYSDEFSKLTKGKDDEEDIKVAITHYPMSKLVYEGDGGKKLGKYDLILAGHYHGGQWRIPYIGGLFIPDLNQNGLFPSQERVSGLTEWGGFKQYVSRGLGAGGPLAMFRFRFFNKPEINLIKLVKK